MQIDKLLMTMQNDGDRMLRLIKGTAFSSAMIHVWLAAKLFERQVIDKMRDRIFTKRLRGQTKKFHEENEK